MEFKQGAVIYTNDRQKAGRLDRVVIDPMSKEVTHLVVTRGMLFPHGKVIPADWVESAVENRVQLRESAESLDEAPDFTQRHFAQASEPQREGPPDEAPHAVYWNPPVGIDWFGYTGHARRLGFFGHGSPRYTIATQHPLPADAIPLKEGAPVISSDDRRVGDVERVYAELKEGRVTHLVISTGPRRSDKKVIPSFWISRVEEDQVHLAVEADVLQRLESPEERNKKY
jgi:sporulation protein YlmC with PRC-barrel domain